MRILLQRVRQADVKVDGAVCGEIGRGLLLFVGMEAGDAKDDIQWICKKTLRMRIFNDSEGKMNHSLLDVGGEVLLVSQFTLHAITKKGDRPSFIRSAPPAIALPLYDLLVQELEKRLVSPIATGRFGANMQVSLINDGPVTILLDSKNRKNRR